MLPNKLIPRMSRQFRCLRQFSKAAPAADSQSEETYKKILEYRHKYPEFLPNPTIEFRNKITEKLERQDMISRRAQIEIPEFYVGSILAVTSSDPHTPGKPHRFVGICIQREGCGLRSKFILRNTIDHQGVEIEYEMYDPTLQSIEVLRLEKRLDSHLRYLRDAYPEYCTFDPNMEPEVLAEATVPVNDIKVKLKPQPWLEKWERQHLSGLQDLELPKHLYKKAEERSQPWEKYDLMKEYMRTIPAEEQIEIFSELQSQMPEASVTQKTRRKRTFVKPTKLA